MFAGPRLAPGRLPDRQDAYASSNSIYRYDRYGRSGGPSLGERCPRPSNCRLSTSEQTQSRDRPGTQPTGGRVSCRQVPSRRLEREIDLFRAPGREGQSRLNVFAFNVGIGCENFFGRLPGREKAHNRADGHAHPANTRTSSHDGCVMRDPVGDLVRHALIVSGPGQAALKAIVPGADSRDVTRRCGHWRRWPRNHPALHRGAREAIS